MPKMKRSSAAKKRFRVTAAGKVMRRRAFKSHLLEHKSASRRRKKRRDKGMDTVDNREALRLLGRR
ncbi:MAG TPA: 50S ribosomal protein L35 [Gaiellales bacterium]|jgi:large subunit ribosomal protein L35|nr:50S ribosomal protein L35 [Gaiellales bacterium]